MLKILALEKSTLDSPRKRWNISRQIFISPCVSYFLSQRNVSSSFSVSREVFVTKREIFCSNIGRMVVQQTTAIVSNSWKSIVGREINSISGFDKSRIPFLPVFFFFFSVSRLFIFLSRFPVFCIQVTLQSTRDSFPVLRKIHALTFIIRQLNPQNQLAVHRLSRKNLVYSVFWQFS